MSELDDIKKIIHEQEIYLRRQREINAGVLAQKKRDTTAHQKKSRRTNADNVLIVDESGYILKAQKEFEKFKDRNIFDFILPEHYKLIHSFKKTLPQLTPTVIRCLCYRSDRLCVVEARVIKFGENQLMVELFYGKKQTFKYRFCENW